MSEHHCGSFTKLNELFCVIQLLNLVWNNRLDLYPSKVNLKMLPNFMQRVCLHTSVHLFWFSALNLSSCFYSTMHPHHCPSCKMHLKLRFWNQYKKSWNMICFFWFSATWGQRAWYEMCLCFTVGWRDFGSWHRANCENHSWKHWKLKHGPKVFVNVCSHFRSQRLAKHCKC